MLSDKTLSVKKMESFTDDKKKLVDFEIQEPYGISYLENSTIKESSEKLRIRTSGSGMKNLPVPRPR